MFAWIDRHRPLVEWVSGVLFAALAILTENRVYDPGASSDRFSWWLIAANVLAGGVIVAHRLRPWLSLSLAWACAVAQMLTGAAPHFWSTVAICVAVYSTERWGGRIARRACLVSVPLGAVTAAGYIRWMTVWGEEGQAFVVGLASSAVALGLAWTAGRLMYTRDRYEQSKTEAEIARHEATSAEERTSLARDMHDVLAHSLSVVVSLSDGTRLAHPDLPDGAQDTLREISRVGREALSDVRSLLARLRSETLDAQLTPATLDQLGARMREAGLLLRVAESGDQTSITSPEYHTVAHILREALTNALRHGDRSQPVLVQLVWGDPIRLRVRNTVRAVGQAEPRGASAETARSGAPHWGVLGMTERAELAGGTLVAGPVPHPSNGAQDEPYIGWEVSAFIPRIHDAARTDDGDSRTSAGHAPDTPTATLASGQEQTA